MQPVKVPPKKLIRNDVRDEMAKLLFEASQAEEKMRLFMEKHNITKNGDTMMVIEEEKKEEEKREEVLPAKKKRGRKPKKKENLILFDFEKKTSN